MQCSGHPANCNAESERQVMKLDSHRARRWFTIFAWMLLAWNIPVILWGAYVRISFSGDGCGAHWPFCNGQVIPQHMAAPMAIEFTHRMMTSVDSIGSLLLCLWAFRSFPKFHAVRRYAVLSVVFLFVEAILGAGMSMDLSTASSLLVRFRIFHRLVAILGAAYLTWSAASILKRVDHSRPHASAMRVLVLVLAKVLAGAVNITLLALLPMQILHL